MLFMGTHFPFHQKPTLTIMTLTQMTQIPKAEFDQNDTFS